jgi:hypothetical protein
MRSFTFFALSALATASTASAGAIVNLNPSTAGLTVATDVMDARYRLSNTNWDQMISTSSNVSVSTLVQTANLGNHDALNAVAFNFSLGFDPSAGWAWTLAPVGGGPASTLNWTVPFNGASPFRSFNGLELFVVAANMNPANIASGTAAATNMAFSSAAATTTGSLVDLVSTWTGPNTGGLQLQFITSDTDMSTFAWTLTGRVALSFTYQPGTNNPGGNLDERLKFDIKAAQIVPAPGFVSLAGVAGIAALRRRRA